jgi:ABC-2 type transport system permease protein
MFFMILNNVIFWIIWLIFFGKFSNINGWQLPEVTLMYGTVQLAWGMKITVGGGSRNLAQLIAESSIDTYLLQPRQPLAQLLLSRSYASGWGDILSGVALVAVSGLISWSTILPFVFAVFCAAITFLAAEVILHSSAFWLGQTNTLARTLTDYIIMLSCYPQNVYTGWLKIAMYVVIPAAVIGLLPVELVRGDFNSGIWLLGLTLFFTGNALWLFHAGIRYRARN